MQLINSIDDIQAGLKALAVIDPRLLPVIERAGTVPLRRTPAGFQSLASIIVSQQVSKASADAIYGRLTDLLNPLDHEAVISADDSVFRQAGLSRPKQTTLLAVAQAVHDDGLDLESLCSCPAEQAMEQLTMIRGIGPWTAEVYLLFSAGHPDIFPARDVALQASVQNALSLEKRPDERQLMEIAVVWAPWRGVAARLFWAYYAQLRGREGVIDV